jgi:hypothetical protein
MNNNDTLISIFLKKNNPNISDNSVKTYLSYIKKLLNIVIDYKINYDNLDKYFIDNNIVIIKYLKNLDNINSKKSYLAAIMNILKNDNSDIKDNYNKLMYDYQEEYTISKHNNNKNKKEIDNWINYDQLIKKYNEIKKNVIPYFSVKDINKYMYDELTNFVILSCYILIPPRRMEIIYLKHKNYNVNEDNYYDKKNKSFIFNEYKTKKFYNKQIVKLPNDLILLLNKFININFYPNSDYIFNNINGDMISKPLLNNRLHKIFDNKKISVSMIRKIVSSQLLRPLIDLDKFVKDMGTSNNEIIKTYIKK